MDARSGEKTGYRVEIGANRCAVTPEVVPSSCGKGRKVSGGIAGIGDLCDKHDGTSRDHVPSTKGLAASVPSAGKGLLLCMCSLMSLDMFDSPVRFEG